jgi:signal transduction histidine kinase
MSLKKKIILSFLVSAFIIAFLSVFLYLNFIEIKKETVFLELTDTVRSKSLQLRRHEKNFFLYAPVEAHDEEKAIYAYLNELDDILAGMKNEQGNRTAALTMLIQGYREQFSAIETLLKAVSKESDKLKRSSPAYTKVSRLVESNFLVKPSEVIAYLQQEHALPSGHRFIVWLKYLDMEITALRKTGEGILVVSKELDKTAREKVDSFNHRSRNAILIFFPLFLIVGIGTFLFMIGNIVRRLQLLTGVVERTGEGLFAPLPVSGRLRTSHDEVDILIGKFNVMEEHLAQREQELLQSKKLAAIGTLAAGVAHELNNPLNNIHTTAQRLMKKTGEETSPFVKKGLDDIFGQTMRLKKIVGDLLQFARGREPHLRPVELRGLITGVYKHLSGTINTGNVRFQLSLHPEEIVLYADQEQLEQVFINLFTNAVDAVQGEGTLDVSAREEAGGVDIRLSDSGPGMSKETVEKAFEPFYTTKPRGTGLGLAIVFNIIQKHHGRISIESREGRGTTFHISLPKKAGNPAGSGTGMP